MSGRRYNISYKKGCIKALVQEDEIQRYAVCIEIRIQFNLILMSCYTA